MARDQWKNRIVGHGEIDPRTLTANPLNPRTHPKRQVEALKGALTDIGWIATVIVNRRPDGTEVVLDGHARIEEAIKHGDPSVPVTYVALTLAEERLALATLDPIGAMAGTNREALEHLLAATSANEESLKALLADIAQSAGLATIDDRRAAASDLSTYQIVITCVDELQQSGLLSRFAVEGIPAVAQNG